MFDADDFFPESFQACIEELKKICGARDEYGAPPEIEGLARHFDAYNEDDDSVSLSGLAEGILDHYRIPTGQWERLTEYIEEALTGCVNLDC